MYEPETSNNIDHFVFQSIDTNNIIKNIVVFLLVQRKQ